jgi:chromosome segregation ATPase
LDEPDLGLPLSASQNREEKRKKSLSKLEESLPKHRGRVSLLQQRVVFRKETLTEHRERLSPRKSSLSSLPRQGSFPRRYPIFMPR